MFTPISNLPMGNILKPSYGRVSRLKKKGPPPYKQTAGK